MVDARYDVTNPQAEVNSPGSQTYVQLVDYTLDGLGNRSQVQTTLWGGAPATATYASDVVNQYTAVGGVTRTHDSNGNLTDDGTHQYLYDFKNRLVEVKLKSSGATVSTYRYDARGRRVEKDVGGTVTRYILDGVTVVEEFDGTDTWQASYIHGDRIDHPCAMDRADIAGWRREHDRGPAFSLRAERAGVGERDDGAFGGGRGVGHVRRVWPADGARPERERRGVKRCGEPVSVHRPRVGRGVREVLLSSEDVRP